MREIDLVDFLILKRSVSGFLIDKEWRVAVLV